MTHAHIPFARRATGLISKIAPDRRRHKRVAVTLLGRFMRESKHEYPCKLVDISVGGARIMSPVVLEIGERVVAYFDHVGGLQGHVVRTFDGGFAVQFAATAHKREKLAAELTWLLNRAEFGGIELRRHERVEPNNKSTSLTLAEGITVACQLIDVSVSGASIETPARPEVGSEVIVGKLRAEVVRHHERGVGVRFKDVQAATALKRSLS
jgi:hypothetical protein